MAFSFMFGDGACSYLSLKLGEKKNKDAAKVLLAKDNYKGSIAEKTKNILLNIPNSNNINYIYAPSTRNDSGYLYYLTLYNLNAKNFAIIYDIDNLNKVNGNLVLYDSDEIINDFIIQNNLQKVNNSIYTLNFKNEEEN